MSQELVRQLTLAQALKGLVMESGGFNHFEQSPEGKARMVDTMRGTSTWWPNYAATFADLRINILIGAQVLKDNFPSMMTGFPLITGVTREVLVTCLEMLDKPSSDESVKRPAMDPKFTSQTYWLTVLEKVENVGRMRRQMYNEEIERQKNPGHFRVGKQWMPYGSVYLDDKQVEMVVINHATIPKDSLESRAQFMENILAKTPAHFAQPAIDLVNELGGNMFAAIVRGGLAKVGQAVAECHDAAVAETKRQETPAVVDGSGIEERKE